MNTHVARSRSLMFSGALLTASAACAASDPVGDPDEVRAVVDQMIADAETRSSLLADSAVGGHNGKNFFLQSADGSFRLLFRGQVQFRYMLDFRDDGDGNGDGASEDDFESGFQTRRTKLYFEGHVWEKALTYRVLGAYSRSTGDFRLEEAFAAYKWGNGVSVQLGQFKLPFLREETTSSSMQLAVERSIVSDSFSLVRSQGVQASYENDSIRLALAFSDGAGAENSDFSAPRNATSTGLINRSGLGESDYALTGRAEWKLFGTWDAFKDFTSPVGSDYSLMLGAAGHYEGGDGSSSAFTSGTYEYASWTADLTVEGDGWNAFIAGVGGYTDFHGTAAGDVVNDDYGLLAQGGFMIPETQIEPFVRYAGLFTDPDRTADGADTFSSLTFGVNYYLYGHASKFTGDVVWYLDETDPLVTRRTGHGQLGDDDSGEVTVRLQWQLLF
ncbi:MAG: hypothetical protein JNK58_10115 [Phycisphaerae bacterium]|nr:hypothetical protein [Phycisphaerae bacterium]